MKKSLLVLLAMLAALFVASPASAHTPQASATCETLNVLLTHYNGENRVVVIVDDVTVAEHEFGDDYSNAFHLGDQYVAHTWKVKIRAHDDPEGANGWSTNLTGTSTPCVREEPIQPEPRVVTETWTSWVCIEPADGTAILNTYGQDTTFNTTLDPETWTWVEDDGTLGEVYVISSTSISVETCNAETTPPTEEPTPTVTPTPEITGKTAAMPPKTTPAATPEPTVEVIEAVPATATHARLASTGTSDTGVKVYLAAGILLVGAGALALLARRRGLSRG